MKEDQPIWLGDKSKREKRTSRAKWKNEKIKQRKRNKKRKRRSGEKRWERGGGGEDKDRVSLITIIRRHPLPLRFKWTRARLPSSSFLWIQEDYEGHPEETRVASEEARDKDAEIEDWKDMHGKGPFLTFSLFLFFYPSSYFCVFERIRWKKNIKNVRSKRT